MNDAVPGGRLAREGTLPASADEMLRTGLLNQWYLVCRSQDVDAKPIRLTRLGRHIALWRDAAGTVHGGGGFLSAPRCAAVDGACRRGRPRVRLPRANGGQRGRGARRAAGARVLSAGPEGHRGLRRARSDRRGVFLYFSDGIEDTVPAFDPPEELLSDEWSGFLHTAEWNCNYSLPLDNRFDPMHAPFLHAVSFTLSQGLKQSVIQIQETPTGFLIERDIQHGVNIDRTEVIHKPHNNYWGKVDIPYPKCAICRYSRLCY